MLGFDKNLNWWSAIRYDREDSEGYRKSTGKTVQPLRHLTLKDINIFEFTRFKNNNTFLIYLHVI